MREVQKSRRVADLSILLKDTPLTYYWMGFLIADGHFAKLTRIKLTVAPKDKKHLEKFARFIHYTAKIKRDGLGIRVQSQNADIVPLICKKFNIVSNKTEHPCRFTFKRSDLFLAALIGFIDGDGCIKKQYKRNDAYITIKCHKSWVNTFRYFDSRVKQISGIESKALVKDAEYGVITWSRNLLIQWLKKQAIRMQLPILTRKWDKIDLNYISRQDIGKQRSIKIYNLRKKGNAIKDIAKQLGISYAGVYLALQRRKECL